MGQKIYYYKHTHTNIFQSAKGDIQKNIVNLLTCIFGAYDESCVMSTYLYNKKVSSIINLRCANAS